MIRCLAAFAIFVFALPAFADEAASLELFEDHVRPTLVDQCIRCHGEKKQRGGLRLDSAEALLQGGDSGPAVIPGDPDASLLVQAIRYDNVELEMPPRGRLAARTIAAIEKWVRLGAHDPRTSSGSESPKPTSPSVEAGRSFWSFQPIKHPHPPDLEHTDWPLTDIDRFILDRLQQRELQPVADANRETLIRRLYYDLTGLPPTPDQIQRFVNDRSQDAFERLVDGLLDSPHFGERWGRHWLDVVRYAESSGGGRTLLFPDAWRYRDYVIDAFNNDVPYDHFIRQQIAGDLIECDDWQAKRRNLIATAFLLLGPTNYELQDKDVLEMDIVDEQLDTIGKAVMGMTIGCARCHDHKFDPIPAYDYYALAGILKSTQSVIHSNVSTWNQVALPLPPHEEAKIRAHEDRIAETRLRLAQATKAWKHAGGKTKNVKNQSIDAASVEGIVIDDTAAETIGEWMKSTSVGQYVGDSYSHDQTEGKGKKQVVFRPKLPMAGEYEIQISHTPATNRSTRVPVLVYHSGGKATAKINQKEPAPINGVFTSLGTFLLDPNDDPRVVVSNEGTEDGVVIADAVVWIAKAPASPKTSEAAPPKPDQAAAQAQLESLKKAVDDLQAELAALEKSAPKRPLAMACADEEQPSDIHLAIRGVVHNKGPLIGRGVLRVAATEDLPSIPVTQSGRAELAQWITGAKHPLTARVMANRVWYWLMGRGIVSTVDNFGSMGAPPSHPLLLDHLASSFIDDGWSVKKLVRRIVLSRVYRLSTASDAAGDAVDPENRLLWRMNRKRLRAEDIRDTLLFVGGSLDFTRGGATIKAGTRSEYGYQFSSQRRSVYLPVFRNNLPELFEVFDFADPNIQQGQRTESTIASQALLMMNHPFVIEQSEAAARQLTEDAQFDTNAGVQHAYYQVLGRAPSPAEQAVAVEFVDSQGIEPSRAPSRQAPSRQAPSRQAPSRQAPSRQAPSRQARWAMLYQTLFECVDFRYLN